MALSDPELELLRELLADDPGADPWFQVGEELIRRGEWADAEAVISGGLGVHTDRIDAWPLLARASLELGHVGLALAALDNVEFDPVNAPEAARVRILALERAGRAEELRLALREFLVVDPDDVVVTSVEERMLGLSAPVAHEVAPGRVPDPMISMERADRYIAVGRPDRAMRVYRRILFHDPNHVGASVAMKGLGAFTRALTEDLSEELLHPASAPPSLDMPAPQLQSILADEEVTEANPSISEVLAQYARGGVKRSAGSSLPPTFEEDEDEETDPFSPLAGLDGKLSTKARAPRRRRRRRSLLNR